MKRERLASCSPVGVVESSCAGRLKPDDVDANADADALAPAPDGVAFTERVPEVPSPGITPITLPAAPESEPRTESETLPAAMRFCSIEMYLKAVPMLLKSVMEYDQQGTGG